MCFTDVCTTAAFGAVVNLAYSTALWPSSIFKHDELDVLSIPMFNDSYMRTTVLFFFFLQERRVNLKLWDHIHHFPAVLLTRPRCRQEQSAL